LALNQGLYFEKTDGLNNPEIRRQAILSPSIEQMNKKIDANIALHGVTR